MHGIPPGSKINPSIGCFCPQLGLSLLYNSPAKLILTGVVGAGRRKAGWPDCCKPALSFLKDW